MRITDPAKFISYFEDNIPDRKVTYFMNVFHRLNYVDNTNGGIIAISGIFDCFEQFTEYQMHLLAVAIHRSQARGLCRVYRDLATRFISAGASKYLNIDTRFIHVMLHKDSLIRNEISFEEEVEKYEKTIDVLKYQLSQLSIAFRNDQVLFLKEKQKARAEFKQKEEERKKLVGEENYSASTFTFDKKLPPRPTL